MASPSAGEATAATGLLSGASSKDSSDDAQSNSDFVVGLNYDSTGALALLAGIGMGILTVAIQRRSCKPRKWLKDLHFHASTEFVGDQHLGCGGSIQGDFKGTRGLLDREAMGDHFLERDRVTVPC